MGKRVRRKVVTTGRRCLLRFVEPGQGFAPSYSERVLHFSLPQRRQTNFLGKINTERQEGWDSRRNKSMGNKTSRTLL